MDHQPNVMSRVHLYGGAESVPPHAEVQELGGITARFHFFEDPQETFIHNLS